MLAPGEGARSAQRRRLTEPHVVEHPCLHKGYSAPYRRMVYHGELPHPAMVQLVGRYNLFHFVLYRL